MKGQLPATSTLPMKNTLVARLSINQGEKNRENANAAIRKYNENPKESFWVFW